MVATSKQLARFKGKNTSRLQFEIKLNNPNNYKVVGIPILTMNADDDISFRNYTSAASSPCNGINANSSCIFMYDQEMSLDIAVLKFVALVSIKYILTN